MKLKNLSKALLVSSITLPIISSAWAAFPPGARGPQGQDPQVQNNRPANNTRGAQQQNQIPLTQEDNTPESNEQNSINTPAENDTINGNTTEPPIDANAQAPNQQNNLNRPQRPNRGTLPPLDPIELNLQLRGLVNNLELASDPIQGRTIPSIDDDLPQLGKALFFAKNLGGQQDTACVACHHPALGGADQLSLPVGIQAIDEQNASAADLLGHGRFSGSDLSQLSPIPRNSPTVINIALNDRGLFWDSRVEARNPIEGTNGTQSRIITPDSDVNDNGRRLPDNTLTQGTSLAAAQARFPVMSNDEMKGDFADGLSSQQTRALLANRFDNSDIDFSSGWPAVFADVYPDGNVTFDRIADAIGEYERSMTFVNNPWYDYLSGNDEALTAQQKAGALLFFSPRNQGGAGCVACHRGEAFTDERHHLVAFPQIGSGKGNNSGVNGTADTTDFGRENITTNTRDRYHFKTPGLLNIAMTAPYGHSGTFDTLEQVVSHYINPEASINNYFGTQNGETTINSASPYCQTEQIADFINKTGTACADIYPDALANSRAVSAHLNEARNNEELARAPLARDRRLGPQQVDEIVAFLHALTDPCLESRECMQPWIIDGDDEASFPDDMPLIAVDELGNEL